MWQLKEVDEKRLALLQKETELPEGILRALILRGMETKEDVFSFLYPSEKDFHPSYLLPDIDQALERIKQAIKKKEGILIWGHEDMDGITSTVLLQGVLKDLRAEVFHFIPKKHQFKHGIYPPKIFSTEDWLGRNKIRLLIAVDCGTTNNSEVRELKEKGVETIIIDHHEAVIGLPEAVAIVNPKIPRSRYPFSELAAVGVVFKFASALIENLLGAKIGEWIGAKPETLALASLGTISDRVPLIKENRIIVKKGIEFLRKEKTRPAWDIISRFEDVNALFSLFATIDGEEACQFFLTKDQETVKGIFDKMVERQEIFKKEVEEAISLAETVKSLYPGLIVVKNIFLNLRFLSHIANRFRDKYFSPVLVIGKKENGLWVAECRGTDEANLLELLKENSSLLLDWGGHKKACGFSIKEENLENFIKKAREYAEKEFLPKTQKNLGSDKEKTIMVDGILPLPEVPEVVFLLPPFGEGNPPPFFLSPNTEFKEEWFRNFPISDESGKIIPGERADIIWTVQEKEIRIKFFLPLR
ncbi:MAG: DHH family phosphoesterase [candidate division WOR-3 bacterium]